MAESKVECRRTNAAIKLYFDSVCAHIFTGIVGMRERILSQEVKSIVANDRRFLLFLMK